MNEWEKTRLARLAEIKRGLNKTKLAAAREALERAFEAYLEASGEHQLAAESAFVAAKEAQEAEIAAAAKPTYKQKLSETRKLIRSLGPEVRRLPYEWKMYVKSLGNAAWTSPSKVDAFLETLRLAQTGVEMTEEQTKHAYELRFGNL